jgi:hypothetical protein
MFSRSITAVPLRFLFLPLAMLAVGCNQQKIDYSQLNLAEVTGTVTLDGKPLPHARVVFEGEPGKVESIGVTDESGKYELMLNSRKSGVLPGKKLVRIVHGVADEESEEPQPAQPVEKIKLPARYNSKSELTEQIEPSSERVIDFDLTSN